MTPIGRWLGLLTAGLIAGQPLAALAQDKGSRVVLVTKVTLDDKPIDSSSLEVVVIKALVLMGLGRLFRVPWHRSIRLGLLLSQAGEISR